MLLLYSCGSRLFMCMVKAHSKPHRRWRHRHRGSFTGASDIYRVWESNRAVAAQCLCCVCIRARARECVCACLCGRIRCGVYSHAYVCGTVAEETNTILLSGIQVVRQNITRQSLSQRWTSRIGYSNLMCVCSHLNTFEYLWQRIFSCALRHSPSSCTAFVHWRIRCVLQIKLGDYIVSLAPHITFFASSIIIGSPSPIIIDTSIIR